jgi:hypothetical protein
LTRGFAAVGSGVDDLACPAAVTDDQVVLGELSADRVDVDAVHLCYLGDLVIVERYGTLADMPEYLLSPTVGTRHRSIMPMGTRQGHDQRTDASLGDVLKNGDR